MVVFSKLSGRTFGRVVPTCTPAFSFRFLGPRFCPAFGGNRTIACSVEAIRPAFAIALAGTPSCELEDEAEADIVIAVVRPVVVAVR